jgi:hypothetical protein
MDNYDNLTNDLIKLKEDATKSGNFITELQQLIQYDGDQRGIIIRLNALEKIHNDTIIRIITKEHLIANIKKRYIDELERIIPLNIPSLDVCMICNSYVQIPIIPCCWKCAKHPLPTCRITLCLQCLMNLFNINNTSCNNIPCPICRKCATTNILHEAYTVDFEKMRTLDYFIEKYIDKKIVQCHICLKWFDTLSNCWKHYVEHHLTNG